MSDLLHYQVWSRPEKELPDQIQFMLVDMVRGRCITSVWWPTEPLERGAFRLWCKQERPGVMLTGRERGKVERPTYYRHEGNTTYWKWHAGGEEHAFTVVDPSDVPDWFTKLVEIAYAKMDAAEQGHAHSQQD